MVGWLNEELKIFLKEVNEREHLYRHNDSWNINWEVFKGLDDVNGVCIYDYSKQILYYTNADNFMWPKKRIITNAKLKELQIWLPRKCFNKLNNIQNAKLWATIASLHFSQRKIKAKESEKANKKQGSLL